MALLPFVLVRLHRCTVDQICYEWTVSGEVVQTQSLFKQHDIDRFTWTDISIVNLLESGLLGTVIAQHLSGYAPNGQYQVLGRQVLVL